MSQLLKQLAEVTANTKQLLDHDTRDQIAFEQRVTKYLVTRYELRKYVDNQLIPVHPFYNFMDAIRFPVFIKTKIYNANTSFESFTQILYSLTKSFVWGDLRELIEPNENDRPIGLIFAMRVIKGTATPKPNKIFIIHNDLNNVTKDWAAFINAVTPARTWSFKLESLEAFTSGYTPGIISNS